MVRAIVVQGLVPVENPRWPGFKETPEDAFKAIILPKDLERACKVGEDFLQSRFDVLGIAPMGDLCLGLGSELVTARTVKGLDRALLGNLLLRKQLSAETADRPAPCGSM